MSDWSDYYDAVRGRPPHETLLEALDRFGEPGQAVDLGCGDGRDTVELLRRGWRVVAVDAEAEAIERLRARVGDSNALETQVAPFEKAEWPRADLVNASFSLPFCPPDRFPEVWERIRASLASGGRFSGHLFGERDGWASEKEMTFQSREAAEALFDGFELERFDEEEEDGETAVGTPKHWHVFHVVARRAIPANDASTLVTPDAICHDRVAGSHLRSTEGRPMSLVVGLLSVVALAFAVPAAADPPTAFPSEEVFPDVNPCTGDIMTVTITVTDFVHFHDGRIVVRSERTITTSDGSVGHGTASLVDNGQVIRFRMTDIMNNASGGYRFRARGVFVLDVSSGAVRVERFELTCLGP